MEVEFSAERICICTDEVGQGGCTGLNTIYSVSAVVDLNKPETNSLNNWNCDVNLVHLTVVRYNKRAQSDWIKPLQFRNCPWFEMKWQFFSKVLVMLEEWRQFRSRFCGGFLRTPQKSRHCWRYRRPFFSLHCTTGITSPPNLSL